MMKVKQTLILAFGLACLTSSNSAALIPQDRCAAVCTKDICHNETMLKHCQADCGFKAEGCPKKETQKTQPATQTPPPLPPKPAHLMQHEAAAAPKIPAATTATHEEFTLESATKKLLQIQMGECKRKIGQLESRINPNQNSNMQTEPIFEKPKGYKEKYKAKDDFKSELAQISQRANDAEKKALWKVNNPYKSENPDEPDKIRPLDVVFGTIYQDIDLNIRDNCEKMTTLMTKEIFDQNNSIKSFNKSLPGRAQKVIGKITKR